MTPAQRVDYLLAVAHDAMTVHQGAHAMWLAEGEPIRPEVPGGPCPYCGVTLAQMVMAERRGHYICAYSQRFALTDWAPGELMEAFGK